MNYTKYKNIKQNTLRNIQLQYIRLSQNMRLYRRFFILKTSMRVKPKSVIRRNAYHFLMTDLG